MDIERTIERGRVSPCIDLEQQLLSKTKNSKSPAPAYRTDRNNVSKQQ